MKCVITYGKGNKLEIVKRDLETKEDGDQWITENVSEENVDFHWIADQDQIDDLQKFKEAL